MKYPVAPVAYSNTEKPAWYVTSQSQEEEAEGNHVHIHQQPKRLVNSLRLLTTLLACTRNRSIRQDCTDPQQQCLMDRW